ncbi:MAG: hypothetical protein IJW19_05100 [Clostridia bacterium]|nr:hypothetical protein [Clostridia bacterium]
MNREITREQLEKIEDKLYFGDRQGAYALLKEYTGIEARPYTAWSFYDECDNYVGDSDNCSIKDLLKNAYIDVIEESEENE